MTDVSCTSCGGAVVGRRRYRMSPAVVAVGYCGLAMSVVAIFGGLIMVFSGIDRLQALFMEQMTASHIEIMHVAGVPQEVIRKVAGAEAVTAAEREDLTDRQVRLIAEAQAHVAAARVAAASSAANARLNSFVVAGFCTITGLLSLLLLTRRTVRLCEDCRSHD
ncbi:MAG: hypothetical protein ACYSUF_03855 [Planctomycetota bacterium]|jgi:hypothetical protein